MEMHSENFDFCRLCLFEPESDRRVSFHPIFPTSDDGVDLSRYIKRFVGVEVKKDDNYPKMICQKCDTFLRDTMVKKTEATNSQIILKYLHSKKFGVAPVSTIAPSTTSNVTSLSLAAINCAPSTSHSMINSPRKSTVPTTNELSNVSSSSNNFSNSLSIHHPVIGPAYHLSDSDNEVSTFNSDNLSISSNDVAYFTRNNNVFCLICDKAMQNPHDCTQFNANISSCMVPNCNVVSRTLDGILPHYRNHVVVSSGGKLCRMCRRINETNVTRTCEIEDCGSKYVTPGVLKCYECDVVFKTMKEFAQHKLSNHNCILKESSGKYVCIHCGIISIELGFFETHSNTCVKSPFVRRRVEEQDMDTQQPGASTANSSSVAKRTKRKINKRQTIKKEKIVPSKDHMLFTCVKPSCKLIFTSFSIFKDHYRRHFNINKRFIVCWQCLKSFSNNCHLRAHQITNCRNGNLDIFNCHECSEEYDDLEALSIHKLTVHNGELKHSKYRNGNFINCKYCKMQVNVRDLKNHLVNCYLQTSQ